MSRLLPLAFLFILSLSGCTRPAASVADKSGDKPDKPSVTQPAAEPAAQSVAVDDSSEEWQEPPLSPGVLKLYHEAREHFAAARPEQGYASSLEALAAFTEEDFSVPRLLLESFTAADRRIDVYLNTGPRQRSPATDGITRPLSFRVWSTDDPPRLLHVIDFEVGRVAGLALSAAIGRTEEFGHTNLGMLEVTSRYTQIRQKVLDAVSMK